MTATLEKKGNYTGSTKSYLHQWQHLANALKVPSSVTSRPLVGGKHPPPLRRNPTWPSWQRKPKTRICSAPPISPSNTQSWPPEPFRQQLFSPTLRHQRIYSAPSPIIDRMGCWPSGSENRVVAPAAVGSNVRKKKGENEEKEKKRKKRNLIGGSPG